MDFAIHSHLGKVFQIRYYDCCVLGDICQNELSEENLHRQFVNGGIDVAVRNLLLNESDALIILGFSIGGTIAWKACLSGLKAQYLFAVSSTRLRHETERPSMKIELLYGNNDYFKPDIHWFGQMKIEQSYYDNEGHDCYFKRK